MRQFGTILSFELKYYFKNKIFVGITVFLVALIAIIMCFPRLNAMFASDEAEVTEETAEVQGVIIKEIFVHVEGNAVAFRRYGVCNDVFLCLFIYVSVREKSYQNARGIQSSQRGSRQNEKGG